MTKYQYLDAWLIHETVKSEVYGEIERVRHINNMNYIRRRGSKKKAPFGVKLLILNPNYSNLAKIEVKTNDYQLSYEQRDENGNDVFNTIFTVDDYVFSLWVTITKGNSIYSINLEVWGNYGSFEDAEEPDRVFKYYNGMLSDFDTIEKVCDPFLSGNKFFIYPSF